MDKTILFKAFCKIVRSLPTDVKKDFEKEIAQIKTLLRKKPQKNIPTAQKTYVLSWDRHYVEVKGTLMEISEELRLAKVKLSPDTIYNSMLRHGLYKGQKNGGFTIKPVE